MTPISSTRGENNCPTTSWMTILWFHQIVILEWEIIEA
jgi:hypothetical protein